jgi:hypothetical protein
MGKYDEDRLCQGIYHWFSVQYPKFSGYLHHLSNERKTDVKVSSKGKYYSPSGKKLQAMGQQKGMPDYGLFIPNQHYGALFFEVKVIYKNFDYDTGKQKETKTYPSADQREKLLDLYKAGYAVDVVWTLREAETLIKNYMNHRYDPSEYFLGMIEREEKKPEETNGSS